MSQSSASSSPQDSAAKRVVVAGGSGFIGRHLCRELRTAGFDVTVLTRGKPGPIGDGIRCLPWEPGTAGPWTEALAGSRAVINLCGASIAGPRWTAARKRELTRSRTLPTETLVAAVASMSEPPAVFVQASGVGYAGTGETTVDEHSPPGDDFLARLAVAWEKPVGALAIRTVILRFGVVFALDGGALPQMLLPFRLFAGGRVGSGSQWLSWVHRTDAVAAIRFAIDGQLSGPVHVTAPEPVRNETFARTAGRILRRPALLPVPRIVMSMALGEQSTLVCDGQRAIPRRLLEAGYRFRFPTLESALQDLLQP